MSALPDILAQLECVATDLDERDELDLIAAVRAHGDSARLQLLIAGSTGAGRASLANVLLEHPGLLPQSAIPKTPVSIAVRAGPSLAIEAVGNDGLKTSLPAAQLRAFLTADGGGFQRLEIRSPDELLSMCELHIEAIDGAQTAREWQERLTGIDYAILVFNATALLSDAERRFVREYLVPLLGLERVAVIVNQVDRVPVEERESLLELVRTFLGPFESQPAILALSAAQAGGALESGIDPGYDALMTLLEDLLSRHAPLRAGTVRRALERSTTLLTAAAARRQAFDALDEREIEALRHTVDARQEWLRERIARMQNRVSAFVAILIKERLLRDIEEFGEVFRRRLPDEIASIDEPAIVRRHLPGYIETVWSELLRDRMVGVRNRLVAETAAINAMIEADLRDLFGGAGAVPSVAGELGSPPHALHIFVMPRRGSHRAATVARGLSIPGLALLFFSPVMGALSLAASQAIHLYFKKDLAAANREAITHAALSASRELEDSIKLRLGEQIDRLAAELRTDVAAAYELAVEQTMAELGRRLAAGAERQARRDETERLLHKTLPALQAAIARLG
ncbi:MAG TPA: hypothetical protein VKX16_09405, partial [Chloroflexota bacterium]|nr:hypothetical protein [Chloroflexota bacterium]